MNNNETVTLLQENLIFIKCMFQNENDITLIFKCAADMNPQVGDAFVVNIPERNKGFVFKVVVCTEVIGDADNIPWSSIDHKYDWVVQRVDIGIYSKMMEMETDLVKVLTKIKRAKRKKQLAQDLVTTGDETIDAEVKALLMKMGTLNTALPNGNGE